MNPAIEVPGRAHGWGLWVALALSLTLNAFVLGGLAWSAMNRPEPLPAGPQRFVEIGRSLSLSDEQREELRQFGAHAREANTALHDANRPVIRELWAEMGKPQPDTAKIQTLNDAVLANRRVFQHQMSENLEAFLAVLTPAQRQNFITRAMEPPVRR